jgi:ABC-type molybdate transport system substrate-binding protein
MIPFSLPTAMAVRGTMVMVAMMLNSPTVALAELNVLMSGGFGGAYEKLLPEFERTSGVKVTTRSGASQGSGPQTIAAQLAQGVPADVVILSREGLNELIAAKKIGSGTDVNLAQVPLGIAVRAKAPKPDVSTVAAFKQTMTDRAPRKHQRHLAQERSFSAAWHCGQDHHRDEAARHRCDQHGRHGRGGRRGIAGQ